MNRRHFQWLLAGGAATALVPNAADAQMPIDIGMRVVRELVGNQPVMLGRVQLEIVTPTDNGNSVPMRIRVLSPMSATDRVNTLYVFADSNPRPKIAAFHFGPTAPRAEVQTRIRLAGSQRVYAIARMADGRFWADHRDVSVTIAACIDGS